MCSAWLNNGYDQVSKCFYSKQLLKFCFGFLFDIIYFYRSVNYITCQAQSGKQPSLIVYSCTKTYPALIVLTYVMFPESTLILELWVFLQLYILFVKCPSPSITSAEIIGQFSHHHLFNLVYPVYLPQHHGKSIHLLTTWKLLTDVRTY